MEYLCHEIYPSIWYTIWFLEALPVVCSTVYVKTFLTLPYCIAGCFCGWKKLKKASRMHECFTFRGAIVIG